MYVVHIIKLIVIFLLYCMYLPVFFAGKSLSRPIWHTYRQYIQIHANKTEIHTTYMQKYMQIHANTYNPNKCAKSAYAGY
jgi:hypothetical protein